MVGVRVAIVRDGVVANVIDAPSLAMFTEPAWAEWLDGATPVQVAANQVAGPGYSYDADRSPKFQPPVIEEADDGSDQPA